MWTPKPFRLLACCVLCLAPDLPRPRPGAQRPIHGRAERDTETPRLARPSGLGWGWGSACACGRDLRGGSRPRPGAGPFEGFVSAPAVSAPSGSVGQGVGVETMDPTPVPHRSLLPSSEIRARY